MSNILDALTITNNADGSQSFAISGNLTFAGDKNIIVSKSADGQTLLVKVSYKVKLPFLGFGLFTRTSVIEYRPDSGMFKVIA